MESNGEMPVDNVSRVFYFLFLLFFNGHRDIVVEISASVRPQLAIY